MNQEPYWILITIVLSKSETRIGCKIMNILNGLVYNPKKPMSGKKRRIMKRRIYFISAAVIMVR